MKPEFRFGMPRRPGFTLIEVLFALALVSFLLSGTAELLIHALRTERQAAMRMRLTDRLVSALERLKSAPWESSDLAPGEISVRVDSPNDGTLVLERRIEDVSPDFKKATVRVYPEEEPVRGLRAVLFISKYLGF